MEQCLQHPVTVSDSNQEDICKLKTTSSVDTGPEVNSGGFDCNICLDLVQDPVVTFCGHLYCWPCIYRWLQYQKASSEDSNHESQCPVCKTEVSQNTLIPLYGRGQSKKLSDTQAAQIGLVIPQRPNGPRQGVHSLVAATSTSSRSHPHPTQQLHYQGGDYSPWPTFGFAGTTTFHPMIGMFGEMLCPRYFRNSQTTVYTYPNTYSNAGVTAGSGRVRRQVMQAERSLSRVSFFLFCCIILCLLLF